MTLPVRRSTRALAKEGLDRKTQTHLLIDKLLPSASHTLNDKTGMSSSVGQSQSGPGPTNHAFCKKVAPVRYRPLCAAAIDGVILHLEVSQSIQRCKSAPV